MNGGGSKEGNGEGDEGGRKVTVTAMKRAMAPAMRVVGDKDGNGNGGKSISNGVEGGGQSTATRAMATRVAAVQWRGGQ